MNAVKLTKKCKEMKKTTNLSWPKQSVYTLIQSN